MSVKSDAEIVSCDVLVVGSGAGGLGTAVVAAANGLDVIVTEKSELFGGATARSGGWLWVPCNPLAVSQGISDSAEAAKKYIFHESQGLLDEERVDAFLKSGPAAVDFFHNHTKLHFVLGPSFPDYHPDAPGGAAGGRSLVAEPFDGRFLEKEIKRLSPPLETATLFGMMVGSGGDLQHLYNATRSIKSAWRVAVLLTKFAYEKLRYGRAMRLTNGNALVARLARSAFDLGVPIWTSSPVKSLISEDGSVRGAYVEREGRLIKVVTRRGVVLAAGGFSWDIERRKNTYRHTPTGTEHYSAAPETNTGDGIRLAEEAGGRQKEGLLNAAAWAPMSLLPNRRGPPLLVGHIVDRGKPGVIAVTSHGKRFVNEANSYHDFVEAMINAYRDDEEKCAFVIADHQTLRRYGLGFVKPFPLPMRAHLKSGYLIKGETLKELAENAGIDPVQFERTINQYNEYARSGKDPEFNRGGTVYNRYTGDQNHRPNPNVAPVENGPFYAVKVYPGDLGSYASLVTDVNGQVINGKGNPIAGLYAAGTDAATMAGGSYVGGGAVLGPILTFGYRTGLHLAGRNMNGES
ncbi:MAG: FAD-dependent oxidoreductase [Rhodobiaceae bacterium]|nr:FAD-dependent oxidoreductase [Rhodobiaceae bacterium]